MSEQTGGNAWEQVFTHVVISAFEKLAIKAASKTWIYPLKTEVRHNLLSIEFEKRLEKHNN
ncbi:hypothetical protein ST37_02480 [Vibrio sp. qd031]|nr:hypothetical protein ST37_02480 [Vibrio sp. qd031]